MVWPLIILTAVGGIALYKGQQTVETIGNETEDILNALIPIILLAIIGFIIYKKV